MSTHDLPEGGFLNATARGVDQMQATLYSFANIMGQATGIDWLEEFGEEGVRDQIEEMMRNPAQVATWDDIDSLSDVGTWMVERLGEQAPNIAFDMALYAGASALAAPTGGGSLAGAASAQASKKLAMATLGKRIKRMAVAHGQRKVAMGAVATSAAIQGAGETGMELTGEGVEAPFTALAFGALKGGLDAVSLDRIFMASRAIGTTPGNLTDIARKAVKEAGVAAGFEGVTEGMQTVLDKVAVKTQKEGYDIFTRDNWAEIVESAAAGALVGGTVSGTLGGTQQLTEAYRRGDFDSTIEATKQAARDAGDKARATWDTYGPVFTPNEAGGVTERVTPQETIFTPPESDPIVTPPPVQEPTAVNSVIDQVETAGGGALTQTSSPERDVDELSEQMVAEEEVVGGNRIFGEPDIDTEAQIIALRDDASTKRAVVVTPDTDISKINVGGLARTQVLTTESDQPYQVFTRQGDELTSQLRARGDNRLSTEELGSLLTTPRLAQSKGDGTLVQARNQFGGVTAEVGVNAENVGEAVADLQQQAPNDTIVITDVVSALQRRVAELEAEQAPKTTQDKMKNTLVQLRQLTPFNQEKLLGGIQTDTQVQAFLDNLQGGATPTIAKAKNQKAQERRSREIEQRVFNPVLGQEDVAALTNDFTTIQAVDTYEGEQQEAKPDAGEVDAEVRIARQPENNQPEGWTSDQADYVMAKLQEERGNPDLDTYDPDASFIKVQDPDNAEKFYVETEYAPEATAANPSVIRQGGPQVSAPERIAVGLERAIASGEGRKKLNPNAVIFAKRPGEKVRRVPLATMDLTAAGRDIVTAERVSSTVAEQDSNLVGYTRALGELARQGWDVSDAYDDAGRLKAGKLVTYDNLKSGRGNVSVSKIMGKGSERAKRQAAFAKLSNAQREAQVIYDTSQDPDSHMFAAARVRKARDVVEGRFGYDTTAKVPDAVKDPDAVDKDDIIEHLQGTTIRKSAARFKDPGEEVSLQEQTTRSTTTKDTFGQNVPQDVRDDKWITQLVKTPAQRDPKDAVRVVGTELPTSVTRFVRGIYTDVGLTYPTAVMEANPRNIRAWQRDYNRRVDQEQTTFGKTRKKKVTDEYIQGVMDKFAEAGPAKGLQGKVAMFGDEAVIFLRPVKASDPVESEGARLYTLGHEVGHILLEQGRLRASPEQQKRLMAAYERDLAAAQKLEDQGKGRVPLNWYLHPNRDDNFVEWFADKVAARAKQQNENQRTANKKGGLADRYIDQIARQLNKAWKSIKSRLPRRFHANRTVNSVIEEWKSADVFAKVRNIPHREKRKRIFDDEITTADTTPVSGVVEPNELVKATRKIMHGFQQLAGNPLTKTLFTVDGQLRAEMPDLAKMLYQRTNETVDQQSFQAGVRNVRDRYIGEIQTILKNYTPEQQETIFYTLATEADSRHPAVVKLRKSLNNYYTKYLSKHVQGMGDPVQNYFPRDYNTQAMEARAEEFIEILGKDRGVTNPMAVLQALTSHDDSYTRKSREELVASWQMERKITDPKVIKKLVDAGFLNADPAMGLAKYIERTSRRAEYERLFGGVDQQGSYDPNAKLNDMINAHSTDPAVRDQMHKLVRHTVFNSPVDTKSAVYNIIGEIRAFESLRVLSGSGIASIPEVAAIFGRMKGEIGIGEFTKEFGKTIKNYGDAKDVVTAMGIVRTQMSSAMMTEMLMHEGDTKRGFFRKALPSLFKYNGNDLVVNFTRTFSVGMGTQFIKQSAEKAAAGDTRAQRYLAELNIPDYKIVQRWVDKGEPAWTSDMKGQEARDVETIMDGINRFVTESVLHPNSSERPTWAEHPIGSLVFHLKTFAYSYSKNILGGMAREVDSRFSEGNGFSKSTLEALQYLAPSMMVFILFGAISEELRQRLFTLNEKGGLKKANYDPIKYVENITSRSGLMTIPFADVVTGYGGVDDRLAYAAGPTANHLYQALTGNKSVESKVVNSIPVLSQFPTVRREIYDQIK